MKITIPEEFPSGLRNIPEGTYQGTLSGMTIGKSQSGFPKLNVFYTLTSEQENIKAGEPSTVGEKVLETFSLQSQALWRLNDLYKAVKEKDLEGGDFEPEEFVQMLMNDLLGTDWTLYITDETTPSGKTQSRVQERKVK